jgi:hypothetical protein
VAELAEAAVRAAARAAVRAAARQMETLGNRKRARRRRPGLLFLLFLLLLWICMDMITVAPSGRRQRGGVVVRRGLSLGMWPLILVVLVVVLVVLVRMLGVVRTPP